MIEGEVLVRHYIFFASPEDYLRVAYGDIMDRDDVIYQTEFLYRPKKLRRLMHLAHYYSFIARKVELPFKSIWYKQYFPEKCIRGDEYVFIFFFRWHLIFNGGYIDYLRSRYSGCRCVLFLQDINNAKTLNIEAEKKLFDHIMVFEKNFAKENEIEYYPLVYSEGLKEITAGERPIDLLFVGGAKGRYELLRQIYSNLSEQGVNCQFYLSNMDQEVDEKKSGIHIVKKVSYDENIRLLKQSKCVLDIVPKNTNCNTLRVSEAIAYSNRVLTNNVHIVDEAYYVPGLISVYKSPHDIDIEFLRQPYNQVDYKYKEKISPLAFLRHLDRVLYGINEGNAGDV